MPDTPPRRPSRDTARTSVSTSASTSARSGGEPPRRFPLAVGVDLVERRRVIATHARFGERFLRKVFTERERAQAEGRIERLVGRFAAKEACAKALGTGIGKDAAWHEIEILRLPGGKPALELSGRAAARAGELGLTLFDVSISDTHEHALAVVVAAGG